tara:strand:+ start:133 stop:714 length:582 start_codon:yes stop_codon:yes gene_type:complete
MAMLLKHPQWLMYEEYIPKETCERWLELGKTMPAQEAKTFRTGQEDDGENDGARKTQIRWLPHDDTFQEIYDLCYKLAAEANEKFNVDYDTLPPIQFTEYLEPGYHYDFHHDIDWNRQDGRNRKISIVIQLTDPEEYEGGDFAFKHHISPSSDAVRKQGTVLLFMPYQEHAVMPITSGSRTSLVGWFEGPNWR